MMAIDLTGGLQPVCSELECVYNQLVLVLMILHLRPGGVEDMVPDCNAQCYRHAW